MEDKMNIKKIRKYQIEDSNNFRHRQTNERTNNNNDNDNNNKNDLLIRTFA